MTNLWAGSTGRCLYCTGDKHGVPKGVRTPVAAVRGRSPRPLDDGDVGEELIHYRETAD
ncbi:protein of unknown function [Methylocaldum szegediense]|uniref:Uncharacterized protein n=1 Tax=Methylocaldum szegediense TaxID=73780 RepID=A0ABN8X7M8_9GAMM|nr:protein of unknown function [Methylocaldum szegediense]